MTKLLYGDLRILAREFFLKQRQKWSHFKLSPSSSLEAEQRFSEGPGVLDI